MLDTVKIWTTFDAAIVADERWIPFARNSHGRLVSGHKLRCEVIDRDLRQLSVFVNPFHREIAIEGSLPRVRYGHNVDEINEVDLPIVAAKLDRLLTLALADADGRPIAEVPSVLAWYVSKADLLFNFRPRRVPFAAALDVLTNLSPAGRAIAVRVGRGSTYYRTKAKRWSVEVAIYDKAAETKSGRDAVHLPTARGIVRVEVRLRNQRAVASAFGCKPPTLDRIARVAAVSRAMLARLARLGIEPGLESVTTALDELVERLGGRDARKLWPYFEARARGSHREACERLKISRETGYRYRRQLRRAGLFPAAVSARGVLEELIEALSARCPGVADARSTSGMPGAGAATTRNAATGGARWSSVKG